VGLVFLISNFFINKIALANILMSFSCSNLALVAKKVLQNGSYDSYTCRQNVWSGWPVYEIKCLLMFQKAGMREAGLPLPPAFKCLIFTA
jgi:hypothetical protein